MLSTAEALPWITISDAEARAQYEQQRARFVTPERRQIQQIVFPIGRGGAGGCETPGGGRRRFAALATERGLKDADIDLGLVTKAGMVDRAVADAAFALKQGEVSQPVQGRFGTAIVQVTEIEPEHVRTFEEVAPAAQGRDRDRARQGRDPDQIQQDRGRARRRRAVAGGRPEARPDVAHHRGGRPLRTRPGQRARVPAGAASTSCRSLFSTDVGAENDPLQLPSGGYAWYEVQDIIPARERPLDEVKDRVEARWRDDQVAERLQAKANELLGQAQGGNRARRRRRRRRPQGRDRDRSQARQVERGAPHERGRGRVPFRQGDAGQLRGARRDRADHLSRDGRQHAEARPGLGGGQAHRRRHSSAASPTTSWASICCGCRTTSA